MANQVKVPQTFTPSANAATRANQLKRFKEMRNQSGLNFTQKKLLDKYIKSINNYKPTSSNRTQRDNKESRTGSRGKGLDIKITGAGLPPYPPQGGKGGSTTAAQRKKAIEGAGYKLTKKKKPTTKRKHKEFGAMTDYMNANFNRRK